MRQLPGPDSSRRDGEFENLKSKEDKTEGKHEARISEFRVSPDFLAWHKGWEVGANANSVG